jgi:hypothetical protein
MNDTINGKSVANMPCCGIYATSLITDKPIETVFNDYKKSFNKCYRWKGSTNTNKLLKLIKSYGCKLVPEGEKGITVRKFHDMYALLNRTYIIWVRGHVFVLRNGIYEDQWHKGSVQTVKGSLSRVTKAFWVKEAA